MEPANLSEYQVRPELMIVHDPTAFSAFEQFEQLADEDLLATYLFRERPDVDVLRAQHQALVAELRQRVNVAHLAEILGPAQLASYRSQFEANPNHLFTHDALITLPWEPDAFLLAKMRKAPRQDEPLVLREVARLLSLREIVEIPAGLFLEGGDVIPICFGDKRTLLIGYGPRTSEETLFFLRDTLLRDGVINEIIGFRLAEWRLNIDGCFFPLAPDLALAQRESIVGGLLLASDQTERIDPLECLEQRGFTIVSVDKDESFRRQACNFACLGGGAFLAYNMTDRVNDLLRTMGLDVIDVAGDQLVKGNGGPHCMTRPIYRAS